MTSKEPRSKEEWAEHWKQYNELREKIKESMKHYSDLDDTEFKNSISEFTQEELKALLEKMRGEMNFYKKIVQEPYYVEHPEKKDTMRYQEAFQRATSINTKGKIVFSLINK